MRAVSSARSSDATGTPRGIEFGCNTTTAFSQSNPSCDMDNNGGLICTWTSKNALGEDDCIAQKFCSKLTITKPVDQSVCSGDTATFSVLPVMGGKSPVSYEWYNGFIPLLDGGGISGATTATLTIANVIQSESGIYECWVTDSCNPPQLEKKFGTLFVDPQPEVTGPVDQRVCNGGTATFSVQATGNPPFTYQWFKGLGNPSPLFDGGNISGATTATLTINPAGPGDQERYGCEVTNSCGKSSKNFPALLTVDPMPPGPLPDSVAMALGKILAGTKLKCTWTNIPEAASYNLYESGDPEFVFPFLAGTGTDGATGIEIPKPPGSTYYLLSAENSCGEGPLN